MTLEAWVKPTALGSWRSVIIKEQHRRVRLRAVREHRRAASRRRSVFTNAERSRLGGPAALLPRTWTHLAMTWDGTTLKTFVDGAEVAAQPAPGPLVTSSGQLRIGGDSVRNGWFNGLIDEVRIYNRPLTATEIAADMNAPVKP